MFGGGKWKNISFKELFKLKKIREAFLL